ncbi:histidinol phosphate aminotransferase apoenzyme [Halopseudomonas xinjiangensis]|uniref:Histidinol-phosphate aminotransferase n=1 Tax=Halopseudomonas xinjiangensis TaxID=487184 RepID=A0A1H1VL09_9GAMM|nr:histidinol-phosphate transaminase [Halopseudomonas xinjiangensis]SDS85492.1 histidinol phosphate aminotransferase apoenzyme [Halopseudomonas xinjiangensis]
MSRFWSPFVHELVPYVPGEQPKLANLVKLNTNENPYGPSPKVIEAIRAELDDRLRLYPAPNADALKQRIAEYYNVSTEQVFVGNGSDEVLAHVFHGLFQHGRPLLFPDITYSFYPVYCGLYGIQPQPVALGDDFSINVDDYARANGGIIFPNPNAPTGVPLGLEEIERLLQQNRDSVVVVDEAYVDFGGQTSISLVDRYPNLLVTQTLSKSRSLAGLRVGLAVGHKDLIEALERIKNSFNSYPLDRLAIVGAVAAFEDQQWFDDTRRRVIDSREQLTAQLEEMGFGVLPSAANFVFARHSSRDAVELAQGLREHGIIVRHFRLPRIEQYLRITIGTPEQNEALLQALRTVI